MHRQAIHHTIHSLVICLSVAIVSQGHCDELNEYALGGVNISESLGNYFISRPVSESTTFQDFMGRAVTRGRVVTNAQLNLDILPSNSFGVLAIQMSGTSRAPNNVTHQGQIRVTSSAATSIVAEKQIQLQGTSLQLLPTIARCRTAIQINNVDANRWIIRRIAERRSVRMTPEAEQRTSRRTEEEIGKRIDEETQTMFNKFMAQFDISQIMAKFPTLALRANSTDSQLRVRMSAKLAADQFNSAAILNEVGQHDIAVFAHELLIERVCEGFMGGQRVEDTVMGSFLNTTTGSVPRQLWVHDRRPRWAVTLAKKKPVSVVFDNDQFELTFRFQKFEYGDAKLEVPVAVSARYSMKKTEDGPRLIRQNDVVLTIPPRVSDSDLALSKHLLRKFDAFFVDDLFFDGLVPPEGGSGSKLRHLHLTQLNSQDRWFVISYRLVPPKQKRVPNVVQTN